MREREWKSRVIGDDIVHCFVLMESQRKYLDDYTTWLLDRKYPTTFPNQSGLIMQPNVREVRLYDISIPEGSFNFLLSDLSPYNQGAGNIKGKLQFGTKLMQKALGLSPVQPSKTNPLGDWRSYINVMVLGTKKDAWINNGELI